MVMKHAVRQTHRRGFALSDESQLPRLLGMPSELVTVTFRGISVQVLASQVSGAAKWRPGAPTPVTDPLHLELLSGYGQAAGWQRPAIVLAVIETRVDPVLAVRRASRWASYAARVAVAPEARLNDTAVLEAQLRGVWLITADERGNLAVVTTGERGPVKEAVRGLPHRLLDELVWAALDAGGSRPEAAATPCAIAQVP
jgi:hypothetical protein